MVREEMHVQVAIYRELATACLRAFRVERAPRPIPIEKIQANAKHDEKADQCPDDNTEPFKGAAHRHAGGIRAGMPP